MKNQASAPLRDFDRDGEVPEVDWSILRDEENITKARKEADKRFQEEELDDETIKYLRSRCKNDLFFLNTAILGYDRLSENLHGDFCSWLGRNRGWQFKEALLPRGHYKSTIGTIADSVQIALPDVDKNNPWPRSLGPDCRTLICHETDGQASNFLFAITGHFLSNPLLMGLFPEIIPSPRVHRINRHELELPREQKWPEPTIDTMGVGGKSQGRHYNYLKLDDLIGDKARDSTTLMDAAKEWFDNIQSFFSKFDEDHFDIFGTRWAFDDLYSHVHERYGDELLRYIRGVEEPTGPIVNEKTGERMMIPIFPEGGFTPARLAVLRKNRKIFSAQYANNPEEGATEFDKGWKRWYHRINRYQLAVFSGQSQTRIEEKDLDICILIDPAMSGLSGIVVTGSDRSNRIFILEAIKENLKPPELCSLVFKLVARWQPRLVAIEEVLFSGIFKHWFETEMRLRGTYFNIFPVSPVVGGRAMSKPMRVRGLSNYFSAGQIHFLPAQTNIIEEFDTFGATKNYHMLDALAYGPDVWMPAISRAKMASFAAAEQRILAGRDDNTGYSNIEFGEIP